jgi:sortase A
MTRTGAGARFVGAATASTVLVACGGATAETSRAEHTVPRSPQSVTTAPAPAATPPTSAPPSPARREPRISFLSVPELGLHDAPVVRYRGRPDDGPGTLIQNRGRMASPRGPRGGVGPGTVGNFIVTGHRTSHGAPLAELPSLRAGDEIRVRSGRTVHVYEVTRTRWTSFRSAASRRAQEAAVPGRPGLVPRRPMLTLSTCATPEDHARGNYWADRFGNPEHRIDKIAVLVRVHRPG